MDRFLSSLKVWLETNEISQESLVKKWKITPKNLSAYVTGRNGMDASVQARFEGLGFKGPWPKPERKAFEKAAKIGLKVRAISEAGVSLSEFHDEIGKVHKRIDHLKRVLSAVLHQVPGLDLTGIEEADF